MHKLRALLITCLLLLSTLKGSGQGKFDELISRVNENLKAIDKDGYLRDRIKITDTTFTLRDLKLKPEFTIAWKYVPSLLNYLENKDPEFAAMEFRAGVLSSAARGGLNKVQVSPTTIKGLVVALDPGHFAGSPAEAIWEDKYVKIRGKDIGLSNDVFFYESDINDLTSAIVESRLISLGAVPVRSRPFKSSAFGKSFKKWMEEDFRTTLDTERALKTITDYDYKIYSQVITPYDSQYLFHHYYRNLEFKRRMLNIMHSKAALTINIHYNAHEKDIRDTDGFNKPVTVNYSMAFVAGGFMSNELSTDREKVDFIRLLLSSEIKQSIQLASAILKAEKRQTTIPQVTEADISLSEIKSSLSGEPGVMHRNLAMNRIVHGPVAYLEALLQDNDKMVPLLVKRDYEFIHPVYGKLYAPMICKKVADAIVEGIQEWVKANENNRSKISK
ncbi:MAG TPA: hypothetical protein VGQ59_11855 [Cyclobacteriaceae bacterium]|jgi:N-acetylmuramoyl-L-alanine amidase|nr:hypothetical protein [Cyclobacteriaceae bacterium]